MSFPRIYLLGNNRVLFAELSHRLKKAGFEIALVDPGEWQVLKKQSVSRKTHPSPAILIHDSDNKRTAGGAVYPSGNRVAPRDYQLFLLSPGEPVPSGYPISYGSSFFLFRPVDPEQVVAAVRIFTHSIRLQQKYDQIKTRLSRESGKREHPGKETRDMELDLVNRELAESATYASLKSRILQLVRKDFNRSIKTRPFLTRNEIGILVREIDEKVRIDTDWFRIKALFEKMHPGYTERLRNRFPELTPHDHKLCSLLRMQMSTKEIAQVMKITAASAEIARIRLRKKMRLAKKVNLVNFISGI